MMGAEGRDLRDEPFVRSLLEKLPSGARDSFSDEQLLALKVALGGRAWGVHAVDWRWTLKLWHWHYYFVLLAGRNRRDLSRREREIARIALALFLAGFVVFRRFWVCWSFIWPNPLWELICCRDFRLASVAGFRTPSCADQFGMLRRNIFCIVMPFVI